MPRAFLLLSALLLLNGCSPLSTFDAVVGKDRGSSRVAADLPFAEGPRARLDVYAPGAASFARGKLPVIVWIYGGSWNSGEKEGYSFIGRALAAQGFVVVIPDYRLVPEVRYPGFLEDNAAAVRWVRANIARYGGDPDALVLAGHSAGAYNAAMLSLDPRWLGADRAAVKGFAGLAGPYDFVPLDVAATKAAFGGVEDLGQTQPAAFAGKDDPPALLVHGGKDKLVLPVQSLALAARLTGSGGRAETRIYPGVGHIGVMTAIARPLRGRAPVLADVAEFARRVTAP